MNLYKKETTAIVLAAGLSERMDAFKPLLPVGGRAALLRLLDSIKAAGIQNITVITGHRHEAIREAILADAAAAAPDTQAAAAPDAQIDIRYHAGYAQGMFSSVKAGIADAAATAAPDARIDIRYHAGYAQGMFSSVQAGIADAAAKGSARALLFPADVPLVRPETIRRLLAFYDAHTCQPNSLTPPPFAVPVYRGKNGHPLLVPAEYFDEIVTYAGEGGLKAVRSRYDEGLLKYETDDEGCTLDMDTPEDYDGLVKYFERQGGEDAPAARLPRVFLVRHGQPEQHSGKIFLGQSDIPLSATGREEAAAAGERLAALGARPARLYASDLTRAWETAEIISAKLGGIPACPDKLFREMAMGSWDGELIEDIRRKFPEEYAKRGEDTRNYRIPGGENFYDLHGRVTREFYRILVEETGANQDIVIVAHLGVIVALTEELGATEQGAGNSVLFPTGSVTEVKWPL